MGNFKDFDLELNKVKSLSDAQPEVAITIVTCVQMCEWTPNYCPSIAYPCDTVFSCNKPSCDCSPSDRTNCNAYGDVQKENQDIMPRC